MQYHHRQYTTEKDYLQNIILCFQLKPVSPETPVTDHVSGWTRGCYSWLQHWALSSPIFWHVMLHKHLDYEVNEQ